MRWVRPREAPNVRPDGLLIRILFVSSCVLIGGVVLYFAAVVTVFAIAMYAASNGVVRAGAPVYAATDEQWLLKLENAEVKNEESALAAASNGHILVIAPRTAVRYKSKSFYDGQKLTPKFSRPSAQAILRVTLLSGPEKGRIVWIAERDIGFNSAL